MFLDGEGAKARDAVRVLFAGEKVKSGDLSAAPSVDKIDRSGDFRAIDLESLVKMKLTCSVEDLGLLAKPVRIVIRTQEYGQD